MDEHTIALASGGPLFYRSAAADEPVPVYLHGLPTSSDDFEALLDATGGLAPDLPGFGRSGKGGHLDLTVAGLADAVEVVLRDAGADALRLVGHDWGALVALEVAARDPERVHSVTLVSPVALVAGHTWTGLPRVWATPVLGELAMGSVTRRLLSRHLRGGSAHPDVAWPAVRTRAVWRYFDQGTQRAILRLHRTTAPDHLVDAARPPDVTVTVVHGEADPWFSAAQAQEVARTLGAQARVVPEAGHWPWLDRPGMELV